MNQSKWDAPPYTINAGNVRQGLAEKTAAMTAYYNQVAGSPRCLRPLILPVLCSAPLYCCTWWKSVRQGLAENMAALTAYNTQVAASACWSCADWSSAVFRFALAFFRPQRIIICSRGADGRRSGQPWQHRHIP